MKKEKARTLQKDTLFNNAGNENYITPEATEYVIRYVTRTNKQQKMTYSLGVDSAFLNL